MPLPSLALRVLPALLLALPASAACPTREGWPTDTWPSRTAQHAATRAQEIQALEEYAFTLQGRDEERLGVRTNSVLIIQGGAIVYERYARGHDASKRHLCWSVTKSVTSALTGIAAARGLLSVDDSVCRYLSPVSQEVCSITLRHLLEFGSGLDWVESLGGQGGPQNSSLLAMLYGEGQRDHVSFLTAHRLRDTPGTTFLYSTGDIQLLGGVLHEVLRRDTGNDQYAWTLLFDVLGMRSPVWERDAKGTPVAGSHLFATPRDLARFGFFYLNDGCWDGQRLLPEGWVSSSVQVASSFLSRPLVKVGVPGWAFWVNRAVPEHDVPLPWPSAPEDTFAALGLWGQAIFIIPSLDMVVVRTADDRDSSFDRNRFLELAIAVGRR